MDKSVHLFYIILDKDAWQNGVNKNDMKLSH
jgi:hypothetical protein